METDLEINPDWRKRLSVPTEEQGSGAVDVYPDKSTGVHAQLQGVLIANEVLRVKDLLEAHYVFGCAGPQLESMSSAAVPSL